VLPHIDGVTLLEPWGADQGGLGFETSNVGNTASAGYNYANFDATVSNGSTGYLDSPYWPARAQIGIMLAPITGAPALGGNTFTPNYVFSNAYATSLTSAAQPVAACTNYPGNGATLPANLVSTINTIGVTLNDLRTGWPGMFAAPALTAWEAAAANAVAHYNTKTWPAFLRIAPGQGGESFMSCTAQWETYLSQNDAQLKTTWENWIQSLVNAGAAAAPTMPLEVVTNCQSCVSGGTIDNTWGDLTAQYAEGASPQWYLGANGLAQSDIALFGLYGTTSGSGISSDHAFIWSQYPAIGKVFQTLNFTDPTAAGTGSLTNLLPWQAGLCAGAGTCTYEAFWQDLCTAWCVNYVSYPAYHVGYQTALNGFRGSVR
jgi:hypothetical protein